MKVFFAGRWGGLSRSMGARRAGDEGEQADAQPIALILGRPMRSISRAP